MMHDSFELQLGHPRIQSLDVKEIYGLWDFIPRLFRPEEESIYIIINDLPVRIRYSQDLYQSVNDILAMVWLINSESSGQTKISLVTHLLFINWKIYWQNDELQVISEARSKEDLYTLYADTFNRQCKFRFDRSDFLKEWNMVLQQLLQCIEKGGISVADGKERRKLELLKRTSENISGYGKLYARTD